MWSVPLFCILNLGIPYDATCDFFRLALWFWAPNGWQSRQWPNRWVEVVEGNVVWFFGFRVFVCVCVFVSVFLCFCVCVCLSVFLKILHFKDAFDLHYLHKARHALCQSSGVQPRWGPALNNEGSRDCNRETLRTKDVLKTHWTECHIVLMVKSTLFITPEPGNLSATKVGASVAQILVSKLFPTTMFAFKFRFRFFFTRPVNSKRNSMHSMNINWP